VFDNFVITLNYHLNPNISKMGGMLSLCNVKLLSNIAVFVNKLNKLS